MDIIEQHIQVENETDSVISLLTRHCRLPVGELKQAINKGALWLTRGKHTQRLRRVKKPLKAQDVLHFYYNPKVLAQEVAPAELICDLTTYSVWYKPYGMLSQGSKWSDHCTLGRWAQSQLKPERPVFIVHRLDKAATGLILLAHSKSAARALSAMFEQHALEKHYQILVHGDHSKHQQPEVITTPVDGKSAKSTFTCLRYDAQHDLSLVDVKIDSGRKHQIRRHAASVNLPVVADRLHGDPERRYPDSLNLQLCAVSLEFTCPLSGEARSFELPQQYRPQLDAVAQQLAE
ncbi:RNA pseudouridine synthase [Thalassomonas viridans]|uniref:RNA pseudouridine synthase n=1 Tax=Thalassomonas viridans TaxID=137584 RepID=A0AAE9Z4Q2_9GAMM|nr:RNA pseudouridine synthase [Thalassomonas viridans]WDE06610.1 RNA pseudouridine synthase [Thalassomonas viridans]